MPVRYGHRPLRRGLERARPDAGATSRSRPGLDRAASEDEVEGHARRASTAAHHTIDCGNPALRHGRTVDFSSIVIDLSKLSPIDREICAAARSIGWGATATYGDLARKTGTPGDARGVGQAMSRNPAPIVIPCHRVLAKGSRLGGFSAYGGTVTKERLLALEGVRVGDDEPLLPGLFSKERRSA